MLKIVKFNIKLKYEKLKITIIKNKYENMFKLIYEFSRKKRKK